MKLLQYNNNFQVKCAEKRKIPKKLQKFHRIAVLKWKLQNLKIKKTKKVKNKKKTGEEYGCST